MMCWVKCQTSQRPPPFTHTTCHSIVLQTRAPPRHCLISQRPTAIHAQTRHLIVHRAIVHSTHPPRVQTSLISVHPAITVPAACFHVVSTVSIYYNCPRNILLCTNIITWCSLWKTHQYPLN